MTELKIDDTGWLQTVEVIQSPNFDARPDNTKIKLIVIHGISLPPMEFGGGYIQQFFCNQLDADAHEYFPNQNGAVSRTVMIFQSVLNWKVLTILTIPMPNMAS